MEKFRKQPADYLDYDIVLTDWLNGDIITSCTAEVEEGLTFETKLLFDERVKLWLSGGQDGNEYKVTAVIHTQMGRKKEIEFKIKVKEL